MPRPKARSLFELGGQWISTEPKRPGYYRYWNDPGTGRTRRASLGTEDLERAKEKLIEITAGKIPANVNGHLARVLEQYYWDRTDFLPSAKPARHAGKLLLECWGALIKVSALTEAKQKEFIEWSLTRGHSISYIARNLGVGAAAIAHAKLSVEIICNEGTILNKWPHLKPKPKRKVFEPSDEQLAHLLRQKMPENLRRWILNIMATAGRPTAVLELTPASRERVYGIINLNPEGRRQNKKFRAAVREPKVQSKWLKLWEGKGDNAMRPDDRYCTYASESSIDTALARVCDPKRANLPRMCLYSFRHRATSVLRTAKVPKEQIDYQLGHRQAGARSTEDYGQYEPGYLSEAAAALNAWIERVLALAAKSHRISHKSTKARKVAA